MPVHFGIRLPQRARGLVEAIAARRERDLLAIVGERGEGSGK